MGRSGRYVEMRVEPRKRRRKRQVTPRRPCGCSADLTGVLLQAIAAKCVRCGRPASVWVAAADSSAVMLVPACAGAHELDATAAAAALGDVGTDTFAMRGLDQVRRLVTAFHGEGGCRTRRLVVGGPDRSRRAG